MLQKVLDFAKTRKCEWLFILLMFSAMLAIGIFTVITVVQHQSNEAEDDELNSKGELLSLSFIFRHGSRAPTHLQDDDPYKNYSWPDGLGGLTNNGKNIMFRLGQLYAKRYPRYLDKILIRNIKAESSPVPRCLSSSLSLLGGMFPPTKSQIWSSLEIASSWQPIPVVSVEPKRAYVLGDAYDCPEATKIEARVNELPETKEFLEANKDFIERFTKYSPYNATDHWGIIEDVQDSLYCEADYFGNEFKWPQWMAQVGSDCWQKMKEFRDFGFAIQGKLGLKYLKLRAGSFLKTLLGRLQDTVDMGEINEENRQIWFYGTHDTVLSWILHSLSFFKEQPRFGSGLIFSLHKDPQTAEPTVQLYYSNITSVNVDIYQLPLNESSTFQSRCRNISCPLADFVASLQAYLPEHIETECGAQSSHY